MGAFWLSTCIKKCCFTYGIALKCMLSAWRELNEWVNKKWDGTSRLRCEDLLVCHNPDVCWVESARSCQRNKVARHNSFIWSKWGMDSTPGLGLNLKLLIFKEDENAVYTARDGGSGFACSGLLSLKQLQLYTRSLTKCPMFWWTKWQAWEKLGSCLKEKVA